MHNKYHVHDNLSSNMSKERSLKVVATIMRQWNDKWCKLLNTFLSSAVQSRVDLLTFQNKSPTP